MKESGKSAQFYLDNAEGGLDTSIPGRCRAVWPGGSENNKIFMTLVFSQIDLSVILQKYFLKMRLKFSSFANQMKNRFIYS